MNKELMDTGSAPAWLSLLVDEELRADATGIIHVANETENLELLDRCSIEFMETLKNELEYLVAVFNYERAQNSPEKAIKFFKIANTVNDFMIYRKSLKMIFTRRAVDLITVQINRGQMNSLDTQAQISEDNYWEFCGNIGNFSNVIWTYRDEKIEVQSLVQYLLTIFIRSSMA